MRRGAARTTRRTGWRTATRTAGRIARRVRQRRRRRIVVADMVVMAACGAAFSVVKLSHKDARRIEEQAGASVEGLTEEEWIAAMDELGIQPIALTEDDQALITEQGAQTQPHDTPMAQQAQS